MVELDGEASRTLIRKDQMNQFTPGQIQGAGVPIINAGDKPMFLPVMVQITPELNNTLKKLTERRGIDGQSLVLEIVTRGLASIMREERPLIEIDREGNLKAIFHEKAISALQEADRALSVIRNAPGNTLNPHEISSLAHDAHSRVQAVLKESGF